MYVFLTNPVKTKRYALKYHSDQPNNNPMNKTFLKLGNLKIENESCFETLD